MSFIRPDVKVAVTSYRRRLTTERGRIRAEFRLTRSGRIADENRVNRWARIAMYTGVVVVVGGLCKAHAVVHEYSWSGSSRFAWSLGYVAAARASRRTASGCPSSPGRVVAHSSRRWSRPGVAALAISCVQLFVGDALLPRFVVLGSVVVLVPWFVLCAALSHDVDARAGERDRVVVVASADEMAVLEADLARASREAGGHRGLALAARGRARRSRGRHATRRHGARATGDRRRAQPRRRRATTTSSCRRHRCTNAVSASARCRCSTSSGSGKLPIGELERVSLLFDIGELHAVELRTA